MPYAYANNVEERVVEMRIDHKKFESGAKQTISVLEKLEKALNIKSNSSAIDDMTRAVDKFDASPMVSSLDKVEMKFSALEIAGLRVIQNLTDEIYRFATKTVKELTIDQVTAGWNKYEKEVEAVQTIMAATRDQIGAEGDKIIGGGIYKTVVDEMGNAKDVLVGFVDEAGQMEIINGELEKLLWFTDETSYNFTDMADNVGKFLAAGVGIEDAFTSMMGIASWGASAGAKPAEVSRAMYNISQAMGQGYMTLMDWKSIENANMATLDFKRNVLQIAKEMGILNQITDDVEEGFTTITDASRYDENGYIMQMSEEEVDSVINALNFREGLKDKWFSKDLMTEVFRRYGLFAEELRKQTEITGLEATPLLELLTDVREAEGGFDWEEYGKSADLTAEEIEKLRIAIEELDKLNIDYGYSEQGFRMGQEAKTFTDAIEATKDAVSSGWMKTFQLIFGDYLQAKNFWTDVTAELWEIFAAGGEFRNDVLKVWNQLGGRNSLLGKWTEEIDGETVEMQGALWNLMDAIRTVTGPIGEAFDTVFGLDDADTLGEKLAAMTEKFRQFTAEMGFSEDAQLGLKTAFKAIFSVIKGGITIVGKIASALGGLVVIVGEITDALFKLFTGKLDLSTFIELVSTRIKSLIPSGEQIKKTFTDFVNKAKGFMPTEEKLLNFLKTMKGLGKSAFDWAKGFFTISNLKSYLPTLESVKNTWKSITDYLKTNYPTIAAWLSNLKETIKLSGAFQFLSNFFKAVGAWFGSLGVNLKDLKGTFTMIGNFLSGIVTTLFGDPKVLKNRLKHAVAIIIEVLKEVFKNLTFKDIIKSIKLAGLMVFVSKITGVLESFKKIGTSFSEGIIGIFGGAEDVLRAYRKSVQADAYIKIAAAIGILALALWGLSMVPQDKLTHVATVVALLLGVMALLVSRLGSIGKVFGGNKVLSDRFNITVFPKLASTLIGFGIALIAIVGAVKKISDIPKDSLENAAIVVVLLGGFLAAMTALLSYTNNSKFGTSSSGALKAAGAMILMAFAIKMLILPLASIVGLFAANGKVWQSFGLIAALIGLLTAVMAILSFTKGGNALKAAGAMVLMALAINLLMPAITALVGVISAFATTIKWEQFTDRITNFKNAMLPLLGLAALAIVFGLALKLAGKGVLYIGGGVALAAVGVLIFSAALWVLSKTLGLLSEALPTFVESLKKVGDVLQGDTNGGFRGGLITIGLFALAIIALAWAFGKLFKLGNMATRLGTFASGVGTGVGKMFSTITTKISEHLPDLLNILGGILVITAMYLVGIIPDLVPIMVDGIITLFNSVADSVEARSDEFVDAVTRIIKTALMIISEVLNEVLSKDFIKSLNGVELALLAVGGVEIAGGLLENVLKPFVRIYKLLGGTGGKGGLIGSLRNVKAGIELLIEAAGGMSVLGPIIAALGASLWYANKNLNDQQDILEDAAFEGDTRNIEDYETAINNLNEDIRLLQEQADAGYGTYMSDQELEAKKLLVQRLSEELEELRKKEAEAPPPAETPSLSPIGVEEPGRYRTDDVVREVENTSQAVDGMTAKIEEAKRKISELKEGFDLSSVGIDLDTLDAEKIFGLEALFTDYGPEAGSMLTQTFSEYMNGDDAETGFSDATRICLGYVSTTFTEESASTFPALGEQGVDSLVNGLLSQYSTSQLWGAGASLFNQVKAGYKAAANQHSPSKEMIEQGRWTIIGLANGLLNNASLVYSAGTGLAGGLIDEFHNAMAQIGLIASDQLSIAPSVVPIVDMSGVNAASGLMGSFLGDSHRSYLEGIGRDLETLGRIGDVSAAVDYSLSDNGMYDIVSGLSDKVDSLGERIENMRIVLDSGELVGRTSAKMDRQLGKIASRKGRGN